jgi:uncharacterized protein (TIGR03382 family)
MKRILDRHARRRNLMKCRLLSSLVLVAALVSPLRADMIVDVGSILLQPDTPDQSFLITVSSLGQPDEIQGVVFNAQVADGYPDVPGSHIAGPAITAIDLVGPGSIFGDAPYGNAGNDFPVQYRQIWLGGTTVNEDSDPGTTITVPAEGILAEVTVDTTGFFAGDGPWEFRLANTYNGDLEFESPAGPLHPTITNGWLTFSEITEPGTGTLLLLGLLCLLSWLGARRRAAV